MKSIQEIADSLCREQYFDFKTPPLFKMKRLAKGSFSVVYLHEESNEVVTKIFRTSNNEGTIQYLEFCKKNAESNPYLPKVYAIHEKGEFTAVLMERLKSDSYDADDWIDKFLVRGSNWSRIRVRRIADKHVRTVIRFLRNVIKTTEGHKFDFHGDNIMYRGTQPVFTDPIYYATGHESSKREINAR